MKKRLITFEQVWDMVKDICNCQVKTPPYAIAGVSRGGIYPACRVLSLMTSLTGQKFEFRIVDPFTTKWMDEFVGKFAVYDVAHQSLFDYILK